MNNARTHRRAASPRWRAVALLALAVCLSLIVAPACAASEGHADAPADSSMAMPSWVLQPPNEPGKAIYAASVSTTGDTTVAIARARENLADKTYRFALRAWWQIGTPPQRLRAVIDQLARSAPTLEEFHYADESSGRRSVAALVSLPVVDLLSGLSNAFEFISQHRDGFLHQLVLQQEEVGHYRYRNPQPPPASTSPGATEPGAPATGSGDAAANDAAPTDGAAPIRPARVLIINVPQPKTPGLPAVPKATADAELLREVFAGMELRLDGDTRSVAILPHVLDGADATAAAVSEWLVSYRESTLLVIVLARLTETEESGSLGMILHDAVPENVRGSAWKLSSLSHLLAGDGPQQPLPCATILAADAAPPSAELRSFGVPALFAGGPRQTVLADPLRGHGLMAWYLAAGLRDMRADADHNGEVAWGELVTWLRRTVLSASQGLGGGQLPFPVSSAPFNFRAAAEPQ